MLTLNAQLFTLYLCPSNFSGITRPLYIDSVTSNAAVRLALSQQLRGIARSELLKQYSVIDSEAIFRGSDSAFEALSTLLNEDHYFFGKANPGLFDAGVFAYTNLLLNERLSWKETSMKDGLEKRPNLVEHRERILQAYFPLNVSIDA